ncbi:hypothetical protein OEZ60_13040 [Defluviimonas sp. WL0024]|uniref:Secreted protein n=2 Tax=Albidovulum TaxID=205889 RepID=A0ABT3JA48_9RHOB|nr:MULTISPECIES: hypothetical protein [Defluviimonas]MCU9848930.1 hypothetical protein [Defluviimonas sp. WL0024]MCW3784565.1 hypothetical protein [Defluviimonas salinarum]
MIMQSSLIVALVLFAGSAEAQSRIDKLCGEGHVNEAAGVGDVTSNPAGYYIRSFSVQLRFDDPRVVRATGEEFHVCTRPAATPRMDAVRSDLHKNKRELKFLFVPNSETDPSPAS